MAALDAVDLADLASARVDELSGGQAQRASLARALVVEQPVLLLDEPLSRVDVANRRLIRSVLDGVEATQIIVTHGRDHAGDCDRVLALEAGNMVALTTPADLMADPTNVMAGGVAPLACSPCLKLTTPQVLRNPWRPPKPATVFSSESRGLTAPGSRLDSCRSWPRPTPGCTTSNRS